MNTLGEGISDGGKNSSCDTEARKGSCFQAWFEVSGNVAWMSPKSKGQITQDLTAAWNIF